VIIPQDDSPIDGPSRDGPHYVGHAHFWERAMLSRRQVIKTAVAATGAVLSSGLWMPALAHADNPAPRPIPGGVAPGAHIFLPGPGSEPSTITDFHGFIGVAALRGAGTGINTRSDQEHRLVFDVDVRFMQGVHIGLDGERHRGTFAFI